VGSHISRILSCPTLKISFFSQVIAFFLVEVYNQIDGYLWIFSINSLELKIMIILNVFLVDERRPRTVYIVVAELTDQRSSNVHSIIENSPHTWK